MLVSVVDASAVAAVLFDEPEAAPIVATVNGKLIAPTLLQYELANLCAVKLLRAPDRGEECLARFHLLGDLAIDYVEPEWDALPSLAHRWHLPTDDAAYLQLALARNAVLITLDARLAAAWDHASSS